MKSQTNVIISEFMASNESVLMDQDGDFEDWIEILNVGPADVDLRNWALTDNDGNLNKWEFPSTNLLAGEFLVVFASGKDRRTPGAELHLNFRLDAGGEYLALVQPDGTIATEFAPAYPPQPTDVSFGFSFEVATFPLVGSPSAAHAFVPSDDSLGATWTEAAFDDSSWLAGQTAIGYDTGEQDPAEDSIAFAVQALNPEVLFRFSETGGATVANDGTLGGAADGTVSGATLNVAGPRPPEVDGFETGNTGVQFNGSAAVTTSSSVLNGRSAFTVGGWIRPTAAQANRTGLFGQNDAIEFGFINASTVQIWTPGTGALDVGYPFAVNQWHHVMAVGDGSTMRVYFDGVEAGVASVATGNYGSSGFSFNIGGGGIFDATGNFFVGMIDEVAVYQRALSPTEVMAHVVSSGGSSISYSSLINFDVQSAMHNVNSSIYARIPFDVADPGMVDRLTLGVQYDDGFVAYLNGTRVADRNSPLIPAWDGAATSRHSDGQALTYEAINLSGFSDLLQSGQNVLAFHGLNIEAGNTDFLLSATLDGASVGTLSTNDRYFVLSSPGSVNGVGTRDLGPIVTQLDHSPAVPEDDEDLLVSVRVNPAFNPVSSVMVHYLVMFGLEESLELFDDGAHGDGAAGDRIYANTIPVAGISAPGQMIRYKVTAEDTLGNGSRYPLYENQIVGESQEYQGTVVNDPALTSKLPIFELFVAADQLGAMDTEGGGRVAVFHDGELYDNVYMELRGNTTAGYLKKSHRLEFPREHRLRHVGASRRVRNTSFTADYGDPAYMRQGLSFWLANEIGCPAPFYYPVRLQRNQQFYQLANHNNVIRGEILDYLGYDDRGALYQAAGTIQTSQFSTGGFRKRTRLSENNADYQALAGGIVDTLPEATRRVNAFDLLDIPQVLNYLVAARWAHENDDVWANMSIYRDTEGDGLWRIIPFDMNLSWGAIYYEGGVPAVIEGVQATNDNHKAHPYYGANQAPAINTGNFNRIYDVIFDLPETREMYLRRLRTVMDQYVKAPGTSPLLLPMEKKVLALYELMKEEADRDRAMWGWPAKGGQTNFDPGIPFDQGVEDLMNLFIELRRRHFYIKHSILNTALPVGLTSADNAGIPTAQPNNAVVDILEIDYNPVSMNQLEEYICVTNPNPYAVEISGWKIEGGARFTFKPGTVIPSRSVIYVARDANAFRARVTGPRGGLGMFVVGNFGGQLSARGEALEIIDQNGRQVSTYAYPGNPSPVQAQLRITELMYSPSASPADGYGRQEYEYVELKNVGPAQIDLAGVRFVNGILFSFPDAGPILLGADETILVVKNQAAFVERYGAGANIGGEYPGDFVTGGGYFDNNGERVVLLDRNGEEILDFTYNNSWYPITDGLGFSLQIVDEHAEPDAWNSRLSWRPSGLLSGSPGATDPGDPGITPVLVNEVLTHTDLPQLDTIELYNPNEAPVDLSGWFLSDDFGTPVKYRIPNGTTIEAKGYLAFDEDDFNAVAAPLGFQLSSTGDEAFLFSGDPAGNALTGYFDGFDFGAAENGVSFGRHITSTGDEQVVALESVTLDPPGPNSGPKVGPVVISEIMYHPPDVGGEDNDLDEYIELTNMSGGQADMFTIAGPWRLDRAVEYVFPPGISLGVGQCVLVVGFDPTDATALAAFRERYGIDASVAVFGPWSGKLDNSSDDVELEKPVLPAGGTVPFIRIDRVEYEDAHPWPAGADGYGPSLTRVGLSIYGNDPTNWVAAAATPCVAPAPGPAPEITKQPESTNVVALMDAQFSVEATGSGPLRFQWRYNGANIEGATLSTLTVPRVIPESQGAYSVLVYNSAGAVLSGEAFLVALIPATITLHPQSVSVDPGTNVTLNVAASSTSPVTYQWRKNGIPLLGETGESLVLTDVQAEDDAIYDVVVTDAIGAIVSNPARVTVLIRADVLFPEANVTLSAAEGSSVTFAVSVTPTATLPIGYRWRRGGATIANRIISTRTDFLTLPGLALSDTAAYTCIVTNEAFYRPGVVSPRYSLTVVPTADLDADGDGIPDEFESNNGLNPADPTDAAMDADGDGVSNRDEYISCTDPQDPTSYLKIEEIVEDGVVRIRFQGVEKQGYTVQFRDAVDQGGWQFLAAVPPVSLDSTAPRLVEVTDTAPPAGGSEKRFYRLASPGVSAE